MGRIFIRLVRLCIDRFNHSCYAVDLLTEDGDPLGTEDGDEIVTEADGTRTLRNSTCRPPPM